MQKLMRMTAVLALAALPFAACDSGTSANDGTVSILLTDAPGDLQSAIVTISDIYLQGSPTTDDPGERVHLLDAPVTTDLLTLANDVDELVSEKLVPAGTYGQLRFVVDGGMIVGENRDGSTSTYATANFDVPDTVTVDGTLNCPSCAQTGIKVTLESGLTVNSDARIVLVDFDVSETFGHQAGNSGQWVMHPTLKATQFELTGDLMVSATAADGVTLPTVAGNQVTLGDFQAELKGVDAGADAQGERVPFQDDDGDGTFTAVFGLVVPGDYTVSLVVPDSVSVMTDPAVPVAVSIASNQTSAVDFTVTSAANAP